MKVLAKSQVLLLHKALLEAFGGAEGLRDEGLLDSALAAPFHSFDGQPVLKTVQQKATRLGFGLVKNHAFVDGNKRVGAHVMLMTLEMNGIVLAYTRLKTRKSRRKISIAEWNAAVAKTQEVKAAVERGEMQEFDGVQTLGEV